MKGITNSIQNEKYKLINRLPVNYQAVEYLENDGLSYIDTNLLAHSDMSCEIDLNITELPSDGCFIGARVADKRLYFLHYYNKPSIGYGSYNGGGNITINEKINIKTKLYRNSQQMLINNNLIYEGFSDNYINTHLNYYIFGLNINNNAETKYFTKFKLYQCKIWDKNNIVRYFIPVYNKDNSIPGLYDLIEGEFYSNKGEGEFKIGDNIDLNINIDTLKNQFA